MTIDSLQQSSTIPKILIVDDEQGILEMVSLCLRQSGYTIKTAQNAAEAWNLFETELFTAIITDVMMPGEDGISFLGKIHAKNPDIPVIIMTGYAQLQIAVNAIKNGAFDFIHKPFDFSYLRTVVEKAVKYASLLRYEREYKQQLERMVEQRTIELTNALQQLDTVNAELLAASNEKSAFMATVSHEMRTPMNGVIGGLDLLADAGLNGTQRTYLLLARQAADNMLNLVERMLAFSDRAGRGGVTHSTPVNLSVALEAVAMNHRSRFTEKKLTFDVMISPNTPRSIKCDAEQLMRLIDILLDNACKFTDKGGVRLEASIERCEGVTASLRLTVTDSGIGIPADKLNTIFEPFTQVDGTSTRRFGGAGLGLGIARNIVQLLRGELKVESAPGEGSSFLCVIPCEIVLNGETP